MDKVCGHSSNASSSTVGTFPQTSVTPPPANISQDVPGADTIGMLAHLQRLGWIPIVLSFTKTYVVKNVFERCPFNTFFVLDVERGYDV